MLAVAVADALAVLDSATIKRAPESFAPALRDIEPAIASAWSADNKALYLLSAQNIRKYDPATSAAEDVYVVEGFGSLSNLVVKDKETIIFSANDKVHVMESTNIQTFTSHKSPITSLSLCNDLSLLASTSANAVHVHNLAHGSHTVLRGLPLAGQNINMAAFHRHSRTRLLIGIGKQLVIFDTTRPSSPLKTITVGSASSGDIIAVACSPFSKTLVAVAMSAGHVGLVDLDKEKGLFRTLNLQVPLTALSFSPEGASIYAGTEDGKLLILDLRGLEKQPKCIVISDSGSKVESMCVQAKLKATAESKATAEKPTNSPVKIARVASAIRREPTVARKPSTLATPRKSSSANIQRKALSPARDPLGNSTSTSQVQPKEDTTHATPQKATPILKSAIKSPVAPSTRLGMRENVSATTVTDSKKSPLSKPPAPRTRTISTLRKVSVAKTTPPASPGADSASTTASATVRRRVLSSAGSGSPSSSPKAAEVPRRTRTVSTSSKVESPKAVQVPRRMRTVSSSSRTSKAESSPKSPVLPRRTRTVSSASRAGAEASRPAKSSTVSTTASPVPPVPSLPSALADARRSGTPSPDLPNIGDPMTPIPQKKGMGVLGLGTPEVEKWINAGDSEEKKKGKGKGRSVGFLDSKDIQEMKETSREIQVSPRRSTPMRPISWAPSPLRNPASPGTSSAQEFLKGIVGDVMFEYQKETKAQMTGLHLELMSMRRGWRKELTEVMETYVGDLKDLREENKRLREENERLKRGY
ncbi:WD40 repeat-like protein [Hymenopellis radicata]|nr:WD40 repeat-like protein [Hymenopellis radicata]